MSSAAGSSSSKQLSRSVYVAQLRRAFLMRAHPDRFRNFDDHIRRGQATLLQALSDRWNAPDFQAYTANVASASAASTSTSTSAATQSKFSSRHQKFPFVLEKRDGSLLQQTIQLDDSVENVLSHLVHALQQSGAASLPPPPPPPSVASSSQRSHGRPRRRSDQEFEEMMWAPDSSSNQHGDDYAGTSINHQFDVNTNQGRDLVGFLRTITSLQIDERRAARMDAAAAALVARQLYSFQAIDGIRMGWSSASFAILLRSMIRLHEEHSSRFHVDSFYPLRLVFSHDDDFHSPLDVYGGILYLHPAATQLQMLESLQGVTHSLLEDFQHNRRLLAERTTLLQNALGVKVLKGFSCSSQEYHAFLERLEGSLSLSLLSTTTTSTEDNDGISTNSTALEMERVRVVIESPAACRRSRVTKEGHIQTHSLMTLEELGTAVTKHSSSARQKHQEEQEDKRRCKEAIQELQWAIGVEKVSRKGIVTHSEFLVSLSRMLQDHDKLRSRLAGYSVGIAGSGHFCHLGDDGTLVVPHDWT